MQAVDRPEPPIRGDERATLAGFLDYQRATLAWKVDGLEPEALRRPAVPTSGLTLLGLVRHMAEVERCWFRQRFAGEGVSPIWCTDDDPDAEFDVDAADPDEASAAWHHECDRARAIVAAATLDDTLRLEGADPISLRWVLVHMIEEYARHNGHADLLREAIDGSVGE